MGIGSSIALMTIGAILAFAVQIRTQILDLEATGVILMLTGLLGLALSLLYWDSSWGGWTPSSARRSRVDADRY